MRARTMPFEATVTRVTGRDEALQSLARSAARKGFAIAADLLGDRAEAEDAVQEALARACAGWERLRDPGALEGWFYRVLTNLCMRTLRRRGIYGRLRGLLGMEVVAREEDVDVVDRAPAPDELLDEARGAAWVMRGLERLAPMQRTALVLRYGHDLGVGEIAGMLGVGAGTVKTHLVRGLARLRELEDKERK